MLPSRNLSGYNSEHVVCGYESVGIGTVYDKRDSVGGDAFGHYVQTASLKSSFFFVGKLTSGETRAHTVVKKHLQSLRFAAIIIFESSFGVFQIELVHFLLHDGLECFIDSHFYEVGIALGFLFSAA